MTKKFIIPSTGKTQVVTQSVVQHRVFTPPPLNPLAPKGLERWIYPVMELEARKNQKRVEKEGNKSPKLSDFL